MTTTLLTVVALLGRVLVALLTARPHAAPLRTLEAQLEVERAARRRAEGRDDHVEALQDGRDGTTEDGRPVRNPEGRQ